MKIGVFGDSYANKDTNESIWWKYLNTKYLHQVECWGEAGSSLLFSAKLLYEHYKNYDLNIWCLTQPQRYTIRHNSNNIHITGRHHCKVNNFDLQNKIDITEKFLNLVVDVDDAEFAAYCITEYLKNKIPNLLTIPTFATRYYGKDFNLFDLCVQETSHYFTDPDLASIYDHYIDMRSGHFTDETHSKLASLINNSLQPGTFTATYADFDAPTTTFEQIFKRK